MKTHWNIEVSVDGVVKSSTGDETLSEALRRGIKEALYYAAVYPLAKILLVGIAEQCSVCCNTGTVPKNSSSYRLVKCRECKGKCPTATVDDVLIELPERHKVTEVQQ